MLQDWNLLPFPTNWKSDPWKLAVFEDWISLFQQAIVVRERMGLHFKVKNKMHKSTWIISPRSKITKVSQNLRMFFPNPLSPPKLLSYIWKTKKKRQVQLTESQLKNILKPDF